MQILFYIAFNFILYSFLGWVIEELYSFVINKRFRVDNFLIGPVKPMYGIAMTILIIFYDIFDIDKISLILLCFLVPTTVEYISGYILKHIFNKTYWSYSNLKYNINGYVSLRFSCYWTLLNFIGVYSLKRISYILFINMLGPFLKISILLGSAIILLDVSYIIKSTYSKHLEIRN